DKAREALLESLALNQRNGNLWGIANALHILSGVEWDSDNYAEAKRLGEESLKLSQELGLQWGVALAHQYTAFAAFRLGERDTGLRHMREALRLALDFQIVVYIAEAMTGFIEVKLDAGDAVSAVELLMVVHRHPANWMRRQTARLLARAEKLLLPETFQAAVDRGKRLDLETAARGLLAEYSASPAIIAQPTQTTPAAALQESLTERELEILSGIAEGLSNQEIADRVILALSTVKWYINQLYGKLGVSSRTQAIARARELHLLV
ncbi:MAG TPA: LuxR C-terminal-related transcriptional regulator, partial [Phototrophicaceae bacterium]|nr:LuxR C-terminal-related transcriptional regulator [Phototrophicaceae bacterium]